MPVPGSGVGADKKHDPLAMSRLHNNALSQSIQRIDDLMASVRSHGGPNGNGLMASRLSGIDENGDKLMNTTARNAHAERE